MSARSRSSAPTNRSEHTGLCDQFSEASYANNIGRATVIIPDRSGRGGHGPLEHGRSTITTADTIEE
jgi:hypothetical protein